MTVDVCSSGYDTAMVVYNMNLGTNGNVWTCPADDTLVAGCTNNDCGTIGLQSLIADVPVTAGDNILIRLGGHITAVGCGVMRITLDLGSNGCTDNSQCPDDGLYCNGNEFCDLGACQCAHTGQDCPDDGLFCNGDEICIEAADTCGHSGDPCAPDPCIEAAGTCGVAGGPCGIVGMESCFDHGGACGVMCIPIDCTNCGSVEPRLQLGVPPTLVLDLGTCGCDSASVAVSCAPNGYGGSASVICDGSSTATVTFSGPLPDRSCCELAFSGDIVGVRTLAMLEGDVNRDCGVSSSDTGSTEARVGRITTDALGGTQYDVNRDCSIAASDFSSVSARVGRVVPPCPCP